MSFFWVIMTLILGILVLGMGLAIYGVVWSEDRELYRQALRQVRLGSTGDAIQLLKRATRINPLNYQARWQLGKLLQTLQNYEEAARHFEYCLSHDGLPSEVRTRDALARLATVYEQSENLKEAIDAWSRYLMYDPDSMEAHFRRGELHYRNGEYKRAVSDFNRVEEFEEPDPQYQLYLGRCFRRMDDEETALEYYRDYLEEQPEDREALIEAAQTAESLGEYDEARKRYEQVRENASGDLYAEATLQLVELALEQDEYDEVEPWLEELEERDRKQKLPSPYTLRFYYARGLVLQQAGRDEEARTWFWKIYDRDPDFRDVDEILDQQIGSMEDDDLLQEYLSCERSRFVSMAERIVEMMGYDVIQRDSFGPDEMNIVAHEDSPMMKVNRVLVTFKRWENKVGEWPVKEFELELLEDRYDRGIFVAPMGFKDTARDFAEQSSIRLVDSDMLLEYLREAQKQSL